jgi:hypothetical protein
MLKIVEVLVAAGCALVLRSSFSNLKNSLKSLGSECSAKSHLAIESDGVQMLKRRLSPPVPVIRSAVQV